MALPRPVDSVVAFELRRIINDRLTWAGVVAFVLVLVIGAVDHWSALPPRPRGPRLFGEAYLLGLALAFHTGVARDRTARFDWFLVSNFLQPESLYLGKIFSAVLLLAGFAALSLVTSLVTSLGDFAYAAHYTGAFTAAAFLMLPTVVLTELALGTRYPVPILLALFFAIIAVYNRTGDLPRLLHLLGFDGQLSLVGVVTRSALAALALAACYPLYRRRLGRAITS